MDDFREYLELVMIMAIPTLFFCGILARSMHKDRSRYRNTFLVMFAGFSVLGLICTMAGKYFAIVFFGVCILILLSILMTPLCLILNGVVMMRREGKSLANLLSLLLGIFVGIGEVATFIAIILPCFDAAAGTDSVKSLLMLHVSEGVTLISLSVIYFSLVFVSFMFYTLLLQVIPHKRDFDYVIIHGAGLRADGTVTKLLADRCDKAVQIYRRDPTPPYLIPSGGQGADEACSEAEAMTQYLLKCGIPRDKILLEDQSTTTLENLQNSKKIIDVRPGCHYTALVTSNYHVYRALRYCRKIDLRCTGIGAHVAAYYWPSALIREFVAVHREAKHAILFVIGWLLFTWPVWVEIFG